MANREAARERRQFTVWRQGSTVLSESSRSNLKDPVKLQLGGIESTDGLPIYAAADLSFYPSRPSQIEEIDNEAPSHYGSFDTPPSVILQPNRRTKDGDVELGNVLKDHALSGHHTIPRKSTVNYLVHNWTSPLGKCSLFLLLSMEVNGGSRNWRLAVLVSVILRPTRSPFCSRRLRFIYLVFLTL